MDDDRLVSGEKAIAVWHEMEELWAEVKHAYCQRRRLAVPEDIPLGRLQSECFSVAHAFARWCQKAYQEGRLTDNPQNVIAYHFLIGSQPLWSDRMRPDMDGAYSVKKWLHEVVNTPDHFMPPDAFKLFDAVEIHKEEKERQKIAELLLAKEAKDQACHGTEVSACTQDPCVCPRHPDVFQVVKTTSRFLLPQNTVDK